VGGTSGVGDTAVDGVGAVQDARRQEMPNLEDRSLSIPAAQAFLQP
jgi:hypothetical protein